MNLITSTVFGHESLFSSEGREREREGERERDLGDLIFIRRVQLLVLTRIYVISTSEEEKP
jgi:hypothetical protein